jgi:hypothetical protein
MTLSISTFCIKTLSIMTHTEWHYAEWQYAEFFYVEWHYTERPYVEWHYTERHYAEWLYVRLLLFWVPLYKVSLCWVLECHKHSSKWIFLSLLTKVGKKENCAGLTFSSPNFNLRTVWPHWAKFSCLATFYLSIFSWISSFKTLFVALILTLKAVGCRCLGLSIWALIFWLQFWLHLQILGKFLFNFLVTLVLASPSSIRIGLKGKLVWDKHSCLFGLHVNDGFFLTLTTGTNVIKLFTVVIYKFLL